jgi:hypothetical protein
MPHQENPHVPKAKQGTTGRKEDERTHKGSGKLIWYSVPTKCEWAWKGRSILSIFGDPTATPYSPSENQTLNCAGLSVGLEMIPGKRIIVLQKRATRSQVGIRCW